MNRINKKVLVVVMAVAIVLIGGWLVSGKLGNNVPNPPKLEAPVTAQVGIGDDGFSPKTIKVKVNTVVIWKAFDDVDPHRKQNHSIVSNPHTTHSEHPELNSKTNFGPNDTYSFKFTKPGTYNYHDERNPTFNGTVIVE